VYGLTVQGVIASGEMVYVLTPDGDVPLGVTRPAHPSPAGGETASVLELALLVPVSRRLNVADTSFAAPMADEPDIQYGVREHGVFGEASDLEPLDEPRDQAVRPDAMGFKSLFEIRDEDVFCGEENPSKRGNIVGFGVPIRLRLCAEGDIRSYCDALEIAPASELPFLSDGDAGAAIYSRDREPFALVFGQRETHALALRLDRLAEAGSFRLLTSATARAHNAWANEWPWRKPRELIALTQSSHRDPPIGTDGLRDHIIGGAKGDDVLARLIDWLRRAALRYVSAVDHGDRAGAFFPLRPVNPESPAPEIVAAIRRVSPDLPARMAQQMLYHLIDEFHELQPSLRAMAWQFVFCVLKGSTLELRELQHTIYHAASEYRSRGASPHSADELAAVADVLFALPHSTAQTTTLLAIARSNSAHEVHLYSRAFLALVRDAKTSARNVSESNNDIVVCLPRDEGPVAAELRKAIALVSGLSVSEISEIIKHAVQTLTETVANAVDSREITKTDEYKEAYRQLSAEFA
jgi:hypothetical protein